MNRRKLTALQHRRAFAIAMGLSVVLHVVLLAFLRFGIELPGDTERARSAATAGDRFLAQSPLRVVRIAAPAPAPRATRREAGAYPAASAARVPAEAAAVATPRPSLPAGALDLRPVAATSGGLEKVVLVSAARSADGASADWNEGVLFEAASRAARDAARKRGRDRRGTRGTGVGIAILGPGGGDCVHSRLPGGGVRIPPAIVDNFVPAPGGASPGGRTSVPGGLIGEALAGGDRSLGGGPVPGGGRRIRIGGGLRIGGR